MKNSVNAFIKFTLNIAQAAIEFFPANTKPAETTPVLVLPSSKTIR